MASYLMVHTQLKKIMQRRSLKLKMQLMQLWKECFKNLGLPGFLTLSLWASSWLATRWPHEFLSEWSKLFRRQSSQAVCEEVVRGRLVLLEVSICVLRQKWARGVAWLVFGVLGCNTKTIESLPAELLYLVLPDATENPENYKGVLCFYWSG